jgi:hypothetical protein
VRFDRSSAPELISRAATPTSTEVAWIVAIVFDRLVDRVLQLGEAALIAGRDPAGQVTLRDRCQDVGELGRRAVDHGVDLVDAVDQLLHLRVGAFQAQARAEVAGSCGRDDGPDIADHGDHGLGPRRPLGRGGALLRLQGLDAQTVLLEHPDGGRHAADLVIAAIVHDLGGEVALRQLLHRGGQRGDRAGHAALHQPEADERERQRGQQEEAVGDERAHRCIGLRVGHVGHDVDGSARHRAEGLGGRDDLVAPLIGIDRGLAPAGDVGDEVGPRRLEGAAEISVLGGSERVLERLRGAGLADELPHHTPGELHARIVDEDGIALLGVERPVPGRRRC